MDEITEKKVSTGLVLDQSLMDALNQWSQEDRRSRNSLIDLILTRAVEQRKAVQQVAQALQRPLPAGAFPNADADQAVA